MVYFCRTIYLVFSFEVALKLRFKRLSKTIEQTKIDKGQIFHNILHIYELQVFSLDPLGFYSLPNS